MALDCHLRGKQSPVLGRLPKSEARTPGRMWNVRASTWVNDIKVLEAHSWLHAKESNLRA